MIESTLKVNAFLRARCAPNVKKALIKLPGVHHTPANPNNGTVTIAGAIASRRR